MEAGFAKGGLESTVEGTNMAASVPVAAATPPAATGQDAGSAEQASQTVPQRQVGTVSNGLTHIKTSCTTAECTCPPTCKIDLCGVQGGVWGGGGFKSMHTQQFRNSFVTSGTTGGDIGQKPTIVAPRVAPAQPVALPPPPPVVPAAPVHNAASNASVQAVRFWGSTLRCSGSKLTNVHCVADGMWHPALVHT